MVSLTDDGSHFATDTITTWLNGIVCRNPFTAHRPSCSNDQRENFGRILKTIMRFITASTFVGLEGELDTLCTTGTLNIMYQKGPCRT